MNRYYKKFEPTYRRIAEHREYTNHLMMMAYKLKLFGYDTLTKVVQSTRAGVPY